MPLSTNKPPKGYEKKSWQELVADFGRELTDQKTTAEGDASQLQSVYKSDPNALNSVQRKYNRLVGKYNGASTWLQIVLRGDKNPKEPPSLDDARDLYKAFEDETNVLLAKAIHGPRNPLVRQMFDGYRGSCIVGGLRCVTAATVAPYAITPV